MGKYNEKANDDYLLKHNLFAVNSHEELEKAGVLSFSLRAAPLEHGDYTIDSFTLKGFQNLHYYLFQDFYPFYRNISDVQLMKGNTRFCQVQFLDNIAIDLFRELHEEPSWNSL